MSNAAELWGGTQHVYTVGWYVYAIGLLVLGVVFVGLAIIGLCALPGVLRVAKQLAEAITLHANAMRRDAEADARIKEMAADVKVIKANVEAIKKAA